MRSLTSGEGLAVEARRDTELQQNAQRHEAAHHAALADLLAELDRALSCLPAEHPVRACALDFRIGLAAYLHLAPLALAQLS